MIWVSIHKQCPLMKISASNLLRRSSYSIISSDDAHGENGVTMWLVQRQLYTFHTDLKSDWTISTSPKPNTINNNNNPQQTTLVMDAKSRLVQKVVHIFIPLSYFPHLQEQSSWGKNKRRQQEDQNICICVQRMCIVYTEHVGRTLSWKQSVSSGKKFLNYDSHVCWIALLCKLSNEVRKAVADTADLWQSDICNM